MQRSIAAIVLALIWCAPSAVAQLSSNATPISTYTVATLPSGPATNTLAMVSDGTGASCTVGGSTTRVLCQYDGAAWIVIGGGGGGGASLSAANTWTAKQTFGTAVGTSPSLVITPTVGPPAALVNGSIWFDSNQSPQGINFRINGASVQGYYVGGPNIVGTDMAPAQLGIIGGAAITNSAMTGISATVSNGVFTLANTGALLTANSFTDTQTLNPNGAGSATTPADALQLFNNQPASAGTADSNYLVQRGTAFDTVGHNADWRWRVNPTSNAGVSKYILESRIDAASYASRLSITDAGALTVTSCTGCGGGVSSVFTRTGAVVAAANDYTLDQIGTPVGNASFTFPSGNAFSVIGTAPGSSSGAGTAATSVYVFTQPAGGATTGSATTGGAGASTTVTGGGAGGSGAGGTNAIGGAGGSYTLNAGAGGASSGTAINSNGGNINLNPGAAGTGGSGTAGTPGAVVVGALTNSVTDITGVRNIIGGSGSAGGLTFKPGSSSSASYIFANNAGATEFQIATTTGILQTIGSVNTAGLGVAAERYNTAATSQTASISPTTMVTSRSVDTNYEFSAYVGQLNVGTSCTTAGSVGVNLVYTDAVTNTAYTFVLDVQLSGGTTLGTTVPLSQTSLAVANVGDFKSVHFRAKASTAIQFSTTYTAGATCSPGQAYNIYPNLREL